MKKILLTIITISLLVQVSAFEFCEDGTVGETNLRLISIDDMLKDNSKEWTWSTSEKIEIEARIENKNDESETYILEAIFIENDEEITVAKDSGDLKEEFTLSAEERKSISLNFEIDEDTDEDNYELYIKFYKKGDEDRECVENSEEEIEIEKIEMCEDGNVDIDDLEITKITDEKDDNDKEWTWEPGKDVEISLELKNKEYSERNFIIQLIMLDENNEETIFTEDAKRPEDDITLDEDENDDVQLYFTISTEIEEGEYTLYAKSYDEDDEETCTSLKAESKSNPTIIKIERPDRRVKITKITGPTEAKTSEKIIYTATVTNFGSEDEDKTSILIYNYDLKILETIEISDLNSGETEDVTFTLTIPNNASLSKYPILFSAEYNYNSKSDYYKDTDEDDDIRHYLTILEGKTEKPETEKNNETLIENNTTIQNETTAQTKNESIKGNSIITGNVIGSPGKSFTWPILMGLITLAGIGIYLFFKKPGKRNSPKHIEPQITRRYTAKLS